jgi:hypothetical protein
MHGFGAEAGLVTVSPPVINLMVCPPYGRCSVQQRSQVTFQQRSGYDRSD